MDAGCGCAVPTACVFSKALLAQHARCHLAERRAVGERELLVCGSGPALVNCGTLAALLRERATFALKLPRAGTPIEHAKALRLHSGGLAGLRRALDGAGPDVHGLVQQAQARWGSLTEAPWPQIVQAIVEWAPRPRRAPPR